MKPQWLLFCCLVAMLAFPSPVVAGRTILVFGDSLSAGYGIPRETSWVNLLQQRLRQRTPQYEVINASISGETAASGARRIAPLLKKYHPTILVLELGANDGLRGIPIAETERNLEKIIVSARQANARVLLLGIELPPNYGADYTQQFRALYSRLAKRHNLALVPFLLAGVEPEQYQPDNLHPAAAAQSQILRNMLPALERLLSAK